MEKPRWRVLSSSIAIETPFLRMRRDEVDVPSQPGPVSFFVRESRGFAIVFALTAEHKVLLVEQYRYGDDSLTIELPAGTLDEDEDPLDCAKRELQEETGYTASRWEHILDVAAEPVRSTSIMHVYVALGAVKTSPPNLDPFEILESSVRSIEDVRTLLRTGGFGASHSVAAAYAALDYLERNRLIGNG